MNNNLRTLEILHYVYGGFATLGALVVLVVFNGMGAILRSNVIAAESADVAPAIVGTIMGVVGWAIGLLMLLFALLNFISGRSIGRRKGRTFSMVVAGIDFLNLPFGTALGTFTLIELSKEDVKQLYEGQV